MSTVQSAHTITATRVKQPAPAKNNKGGEGVRVYNMKIFSQLIADAPDDARPASAEPPKPKTAEEARREIREEEFQRMQERRQQQTAEQLKRVQIKAQQRRDAKFESMVKTLDNGKALTDSIDRFITVTEAAEVTKKEQLYVDWETDVFETVQHSVNQSVESVDYKALAKKRHAEFQKFLDTSNNTAGGVFLNTVFEGDTEPAKPHSLKAKTRPMKDPVRKSLLKHQAEVALTTSTNASPSGRNAPKERETLDTTLWSDGKIQATPYGHFAHFVGKEHNPTEMQKKMTASKVQFDSYDYPTDGYRQEGGKRVYTDKANVHATLYPPDGPWKAGD
jgi:hypothetical protein